MAKWGLFLLGTFSMTQVHVIGNIGISELVLFIIAPIIFCQDRQELRRDGFSVIVWLSILTCCGCVCASLCNHTYFPMAMRGFASPYAIFSTLVVGHRLVRRAPDGIGLFVLGVALSWTINIFVFHRGVEAEIVMSQGSSAVEAITAGKLFWINRLNAWIRIPIQGWYLQSPLAFSIFAPIGMFLFAALTTESGRSAAATALGGAIVVALGRKSQISMRKVSKNILLVMSLALLIVSALTSTYKWAATTGKLGEVAAKKYDNQTRGKNGVIALLMGGRAEFFVGGWACLRNPIVGYGPWAIDTENLYESFICNFGDDEAIAEYCKTKEWFAGLGYSRVTLIPAHSHIVGFWLWYGIFGLILWVYVIVQIIRYFRKDLATVPQWYGFLAVATPSILWEIFFSPFGERVSTTMFIVLLMMTRAVRCGRLRLPTKMIEEMNRFMR